MKAFKLVAVATLSALLLAPCASLAKSHHGGHKQSDVRTEEKASKHKTERTERAAKERAENKDEQKRKAKERMAAGAAKRDKKTIKRKKKERAADEIVNNKRVLND
jgi:hypothetical protein